MANARRIFLSGIVSTFICAAVFAQTLTPPQLTNCPCYDVIVTRTTPLLSFNNASGGQGKRSYDIQLDISDSFDTDALVSYQNVPEGNIYVPVKNDKVTSKKVLPKDALRDNTKYYWRVRARDEAGNVSKWATSRFSVDTKSDDKFMNLVRIPAKAVMASSGDCLKNLTDYSDQGQSTFWQAVPPGQKTQWIIFDLQKRRAVSRIWMLSNPKMTKDKWLKSFRWLASDDGKKWKPVAGAAVNKNNTYRNILDFSPTWAKYFKLEITSWFGYAPQLNCVILYSPGKPAIPATPDQPYVLCVGNQLNGFTFSPLAAKIRSLPLGLETITVPHHEVSLEMVNSLKRKPVAIVLSGNNADYNREPMFEFNGEYELIRHCRIPIYGICCGHQMTAFAYGYTNIRSMGWCDITSLRQPTDRTKIEIVKPIAFFDGLPNPFTAPEVHGCEVAELPENYVLTAKSTYVQCMMRTDKILFTSQFHPEIRSTTNQALPYFEAFLKMAIKHAAKEK